MKITPLNGHVIAEIRLRKPKSGLIVPDSIDTKADGMAIVVSSDFDKVPVGAEILFAQEKAQLYTKEKINFIMLKGEDVIGLVEVNKCSQPNNYSQKHEAS